MPTNDETPVNFTMLLDAIDGCGQAFGRALCIAISAQSEPQQVQLIARLLNAQAQDRLWTGPASHCMTNIVTGYINAMRE